MSGLKTSSLSLLPSLRDRIRQQLADLKMPGVLESLDHVLAAVDGGKVGQVQNVL